MRTPAVLLAIAALLGGCVTDAAPADLATAGPGDGAPAAAAPWEATADTSVGWIAGAGDHVYLGDLVVGLKSHERCPRTSFVVPEGATSLDLVVGAGDGVGAYTLAIASAGAVEYVTLAAAEEVRRAFERPEAGVWQVELKPRGATADQVLPVAATLRGTGAPAPLLFHADPDCLA